MLIPANPLGTAARTTLHEIHEMSQTIENRPVNGMLKATSIGLGKLGINEKNIDQKTLEHIVAMLNTLGNALPRLGQRRRNIGTVIDETLGGQRTQSLGNTSLAYR